jgi:hypothetical protein
VFEIEAELWGELSAAEQEREIYLAAQEYHAWLRSLSPTQHWAERRRAELKVAGAYRAALREVRIDSFREGCLPLMRAAGKGRVVNMGSLAGKEGLPNLAVYSAASAGVIAFTKALSREVNDTGIRVNCVAPGPIDTRMIRDLGHETVDAMVTASPLSRLGDPVEVAALVLWLCSDASAFNTGGVFDMSGGRARY